MHVIFYPENLIRNYFFFFSSYNSIIWESFFFRYYFSLHDYIIMLLCAVLNYFLFFLNIHTLFRQHTFSPPKRVKHYLEPTKPFFSFFYFKLNIIVCYYMHIRFFFSSLQFISKSKILTIYFIHM